MIIKNIPHLIKMGRLNKDNYYIIDNYKEVQDLYNNGFLPITIVKDNYYFVKSKELIDFVERRKAVE